MPETYIYNNVMEDACVNLNGKASTFCAPPLVQCTETDNDGFLTLCEKAYCPIKCNSEPESAGIIPFQRGDVIHIQTQFRDLVNTDIENPTLGWGDWVKIELWDLTSNPASLVSADHTLFASKWYVCHNGDNSYQVIEIDTAKLVTGELIIPDCWGLKVYSLNGTGGEATIDQERCTHQFSLIQCNAYSNENNLIEGVGYIGDIDCVSNYYGTPECGEGQTGATFFKYLNKTRIDATIRKTTTETENEDNRITIIENYELKPKSMLSYQIIGWYINLFSGKRVKINGIETEISNFVPSYRNETEHAAYVTFTWQQKCKKC